MRRRGADDPGERATPIEDPAAIERLVAAAAAEGPRTRAFLLLGLDGALRRGEAEALRWGDLREDGDRHVLAVRRARPRGARADSPLKARNSRRDVEVSRRLLAALRELYLARGRPPDDALVLAGLNPRNFARRAEARVWRAAGLDGAEGRPRHTYHHLRDTYGSWLLALGIDAEYVARQLGHGANVGTTRTHYARRPHDRYVRPPDLGPGEVPADLLARLADIAGAASLSTVAGRRGGAALDGGRP